MEIQCKICFEKFSGENHLVGALYHLKQAHPREFEKKCKKKRLSETSKDLCSPVVTSTRSSLVVPLKVSNCTQTCDQSESEHAVCKPEGSTIHEVPDRMKEYFSVTDSKKPYKCHVCGNQCSNLKMCVVHLLRRHNIPLKSKPSISANQSVDAGKAEATCSVKMLRQTARKSIRSSLSHNNDPMPSSVKPPTCNNNSSNLLKSCSKLDRLKYKARKIRNEQKIRPRHRSYFKFGYKSYWQKKHRLKKQDTIKRKDRLRISKIKIALRRQKHTHRLVLNDAFENISPESLSPENCFELISSCSNSSSPVSDLCILESPPHPTCNNNPIDNSVPQLCTSSGVVSSSVSQDVPSKDGESSEDQQSSSNVLLKELFTNPSTDSSKKIMENDSLWSKIAWNSTQALASNKVSSSGIPIPKRSLSTGNCSSSDASLENPRSHEVLSCATMPQSTAMLKQLKSRSFKSSKLSNATVESSPTPQNAEVTDKIHSISPAISSSITDDHSANTKEQTHSCSSVQKKTARKTTRPSTAKKIVKQRVSDSFIRYLDNSSIEIALQRNDTNSHKANYQSSSTSQSYLNYISSLNDGSVNEITSSSYDNSLSESNSSTCLSRGILSKFSALENRSKKATGRKSVHSNYAFN